MVDGGGARVGPAAGMNRKTSLSQRRDLRPDPPGSVGLELHARQLARVPRVDTSVALTQLNVKNAKSVQIDDREQQLRMS